MCQNIVPLHALASVVPGAEVVLGCRVSLLGGPSVPLHRLSVVLRNTASCVIHGAEFVLGFDLALLGIVLIEDMRCFVVPSIIGGIGCTRDFHGHEFRTAVTAGEQESEKSDRQTVMNPSALPHLDAYLSPPIVLPIEWARPRFLPIP